MQISFNCKLPLKHRLIFIIIKLFLDYHKNTEFLNSHKGHRFSDPHLKTIVGSQGGDRKSCLHCAAVDSSAVYTTVSESQAVGETEVPSLFSKVE